MEWIIKGYDQAEEADGTWKCSVVFNADDVDQVICLIAHIDLSKYPRNDPEVKLEVDTEKVKTIFEEER